MKILISMALSLSVSIQAATVFETQVLNDNKTGHKYQQVWLNDAVARVNNDTQNKHYSLLLLDNSHKSYFIDTDKKQVMDLSEPPPMPAKATNIPVAQPIQALLKKHSQGSVIAGYSTIEYHIYVNNQLCFREFVSLEVLKLPHVSSFLQTMKQRSALRHQQQMHLPFIPTSDCDKARQQVADQLIAQGAILRTVNAQGIVQFEMHKINLNQIAPEHYFDLPIGFKVSNPQQLMQEMLQKSFKQQSH